jgi:BirA family transcriptional regulator, biotin operon repressor / biotin---[acetyl-CoA-carboxylase] ligase
MTGSRIIRLDDTLSTNVVAMELGLRDYPDGTMVVARRQSGGKGRRARSFHSPPGGLYLSVIIRPDIQSDRVSLLTLAAGLAVAEAVEHFTAGEQLQLKWPNDLYMACRKLGGILTETGPFSHAAGNFPFIIVGIGLNVNTATECFPSDLRGSITSLYDMHHHRFDLDEIMEEAWHQLQRAVAFLKTDPSVILSGWRGRDYLRGRKVLWRDDQGKVISGIAAGLLDDGCYELIADDGMKHAILAGELTVIS